MKKENTPNKIYILIVVIIVVIFINLPSHLKDKLIGSSTKEDIYFYSVKNIQEKQTELTFEKLKQYKGFENVTENEAQKEIDAIKTLTKVLYYMYAEDELKNNANQNQS